MRLKDRVAIVTGAARGIGQAYGLALAREGAKVIAADILSCGETIAKIQSKTMWNNLFIGHRVSVGALGNAGWSCTLFASYSQWIVGPFAMSVSQEPCVFAMIVGWEIRLFASPSLTVRKPLQVSTDTIVE